MKCDLSGSYSVSAWMDRTCPRRRLCRPPRAEQPSIFRRSVMGCRRGAIRYAIAPSIRSCCGDARHGTAAERRQLRSRQDALGDRPTSPAIRRRPMAATATWSSPSAAAPAHASGLGCDWRRVRPFSPTCTSCGCWKYQDIVSAWSRSILLCPRRLHHRRDQCSR